MAMLVLIKAIIINNTKTVVPIIRTVFKLSGAKPTASTQWFITGMERKLSVKPII